MHLAALIATSYAPGHNFWPGSPISWWIRGTLMFLLMTGPIVVAWLLVVLMSRRRISVWRWIVPLFVCVLFAFAVNDFPLRDGDMPAFRGAKYGKLAAPWLVIVAAVSLPVAILWERGRDRRRGFEVIKPEGTRT